MSRERVEDLGRVLEIVNQILKSDLFDDGYAMSEEGFINRHIKSENATENLHQLYKSIDAVYDRLTDVRDICEGNDSLNEQDDDIYRRLPRCTQ